MSQHEKLLRRLQAKPTPGDIRWTELVTLMVKLGYKVLNGSGSRKKFFNAERDLLVSLHSPHPGPEVAKGCIEDVRRHLSDNNLI